MSLVLHRKQVREHPELSFLGFDIRRLLSEVQGGFRTLPARPIEVRLQTQHTLACVAGDEVSASIRLHSVLNHPQTPRRVIAFVLCHELLHLVVPPREVDGQRKMHPPEFWQAEAAMAPDRAVMWAWIILVLGSCLRRDKRQECAFVKANWKWLMSKERPTLAQVAAILESGKAAPNGQEEPLL
jgi:hypothetical protein